MLFGGREAKELSGGEGMEEHDILVGTAREIWALLEPGGT